MQDDEEDNGCEETLAADDGSKHSDSTNHWDRIVSALEGAWAHGHMTKLGM